MQRLLQKEKAWPVPNAATRGPSPVARTPPLRVVQSARHPATVPTLSPIHHAKALWHTSAGLNSHPPAGSQWSMGKPSVPSKARTLAAGMPLGRGNGCGRHQRICPKPRPSPCGFLAAWTRPRRRWSRRFPCEASSFKPQAFQASSACCIIASSYKTNSTLKSFTLVCVGPVTTKSPSASK